MVTCFRNPNKSSSPFISTPIYRQLQFNQDEDEEEEEEPDHIWLKIKVEAASSLHQEPILSNYFHLSILSHRSLESSLAYQLAVKLSVSDTLSIELLSQIFNSAFKEDSDIREAIRADLRAARDRDPACQNFFDCFLNYKGFLALQSYRAANWYWKQGRFSVAVLIQGRASAALGVDIHPGARIGRGILIDHGTGLVIGETTVVGDGVTILHGVTLGSRGKREETGEVRHPKVDDGVFVGAGACVLGNVTVGKGAKIGAGAVVVMDVPPEATAVGNPARVIGGKGKM